MCPRSVYHACTAEVDGAEAVVVSPVRYMLLRQRKGFAH